MSDRTIPLADDLLLGPGVRKIAAGTGLTYQQARHAIDNGRLPVFKLGNRTWARLSEVAAVLTATNPDKAA